MAERSWFWSGTTVGHAALPQPYGAPYSDDMFSDVLRAAFQFDRTRSGVVLTVNPPFDTNFAATITGGGAGPGSVLIEPGRAFVDGKLYESDSTLTFNFSTEGWYQVVLRKDFAAQTIQMIFRQGQSVTQLDGVIWEIELYKIEHRPNNGTGSYTDLHDRRMYVAAQTGALIQLYKIDFNLTTPGVGNPPTFDFAPYSAGKVFSEYIFEFSMIDGVNNQAQNEMYAGDYAQLEMYLNSDFSNPYSYSVMTWDVSGDTSYNILASDGTVAFVAGLVGGLYYWSSNRVTLKGLHDNGPKHVSFEFNCSPGFQGATSFNKRPYVGRGGGVFNGVNDIVHEVTFRSSIGNHAFASGEITVYGRV